jgi:valine--pyruvate aminotransferase
LHHVTQYRIDFDNLNITDDIAAICLSRPTNPTANVVTDEEMERLSVIAKEHNIPLIIDNAYGNPFPQAIFTEASLMWDEHTVLSFSLSKIGLPATRTGIIIARPEIIRGLSNLNAIIGLTSGSIGATLAAPLIESGELKKLAETHVTKYYQERSDFAVEKLMHYLRDDVPYRIHVNEGAFFLWLWCEDFPITSRELYERLKAKDVIIVPGEYFFPGCDRTDWDHKTECVRISFVKSKTEVEAGLKIIAEVVNEVYGML